MNPITSAFVFGGKRTVNQLHTRATRNILRRHAQQQSRFESSSSKSKVSRNASTLSSNTGEPAPFSIPTPSWPWAEPLLTPFRAYGRMHRRRPLLTQWFSTLTIYYLGDLSAQAIATNNFKESSYEPERGVRALIIGGLSSIPSYKWFLFLGRHFNYSSHTVSLAVKIVINQTFFTPVFNTYFFGMQSLLSGATLEETKRRVLETVPVSWKNSWKVWPLVTALNFSFVDPQYRSVVAGVIAIGWQSYLSWLNKKAEAMEAAEDAETAMQDVNGKEVVKA